MVSDHEDVEVCPDCGCPQQEWRSRKHVRTCPRSVTKDRDADGLRRLIRACLRGLDEERDLLRKTAERWKRDADSDDYWGHHNADLLLDLLPDE